VKFRASLDAHEATLAGGQPLVKGQEYDLTPQEQQDPFNTRLIAEGQLISISQTDKARADAEGRLSATPPATATPPSPPDKPNEGGS
jgi:hypothetical protein